MDELLLDDLRWCPMQTAIELLHKRRTGVAKLAITLLKRKSGSGKLRSMRCEIASGDGEILSAAFWANGEGKDVSEALLESVRVLDFGPRHKRSLPPIVITSRWAYFVWQPDLNRLLGGAPVDRDADIDSPPVKPGKKATGDWPTLVAQWLIEVAVDDPQRLKNVDALLIEAKLFLRKQIKWAPKDDKDLRATIRELLKRVRR